MTTPHEVTALPVPRSHPLDPPPRYRELARERPIQRVRTGRGDMTWLVSRYEDAQVVLSDRRFSADPRTPGFPSYMVTNKEPLPGFFMTSDAPDHTRLRRQVNREFVASIIEPMRPRMRETFDGLVDTMVRAGDSAELIGQLALPMASSVICTLLGARDEDREHIKTNVDRLLDTSKTAEQQEEAGMALFTYFDRLVTAKEQSPSDDLLGRLVAVAAGGDLTHIELIGISALLLLGGYDTMVQMIGLGVLTLLEHPDQLAQLKADESLISGAVDELLRYLTVNHSGLPRAALEDVLVGDQLIRKHEGVLVMINAANRDESVFTDADTFDIHRTGTARHLAFGHGVHKCIGIALAKAELETVFSGLLRRLPNLRVTKPMDSLSFRHSMVLYGVEALPITW
jgi:cytochrome P450